MTEAGPSHSPLPHPAEVARLRSQDPQAFTKLVERSRRIVLGIGQSLGLRGADLDDAAADVFLAVYRALPTFQGKSAATTWTYSIAVRTLSRWRERKRSRTPTSLPDTAIEDATAAPPHQIAEENEMTQRVWSAVAALDPQSASAVELYYRRDFDLETIASVLNCPVGTVKTLLYRARQKLKITLSREDGNHG